MSINWWTLGLQTINVAVLVWLLGRFFWRPVAAMIVQRQDAARQLLADAEARRTEAADALKAIDQTRAGFAQERQAILAAAQAAAEGNSASRLARAEKEAEALQAAATAALDKQRAATEQAWSDRSSRLAVEIAGRLLVDQDSAAVRAHFLDRLVREIERLPAPARQALAQGGRPYEVVSATPLDGREEERCRGLLTAATGGTLSLAFRSDPALVAGIELHGPDLVVSNSWRAELDRIRTDLQHDHER